ncbi:MAG: tetratricopeptide repeat protein [Acidobacteriia bacterium]|nr:tetratricopeptide repeat protein [Terriglobia bacterium]
MSPPGLRPWASRIAMTALVSILLCTAAGCRPATVRVPVAPEDLARANTVATEGDIAFARKDYYAALIKYLEAGRLNPNSEYVQNKLGITYSRLRFYPEAISAFNRSIALDPKYSFSYNNLGSVYFADNNKKKAEAYFRKAIGLKNDEASFHINLGTLLFEKGKYEKGLQELRKGLSLDPDIMKRSVGDGLVAAVAQKSSAEKNYFMARFYASMGNAERAVENLQQALTNGFTNLEALRTEKDFDPIRQDEKFIAFMKYAAQLIKS